MIKTFNINLAGQIFNINEDAYEHLSGYFNSLRTFYANEDDKDEIIRDIEARFAELFLAKGKNYIVTLADLMKKQKLKIHLLIAALKIALPNKLQVVNVYTEITTVV